MEPTHEEQRTPAAESRRHSEGLGPFEKFVESSHRVVSSAPFFLVMLVIVAAWAASYPLWHDAHAWQIAIHTIASVVALVLLVLLENSGRRSQEATQEKLNVIAEALSALMTHHASDNEELRDAVRKLRESVGLEERH
ncbi:hypothetical protein DDE18_13055 [Nocardioides gansuensis]|uniref:Low affinity iron permease family protein n=1 Tax=Nocardioides gansuensis TaxID=2138300 RepID=A0A2T8FA28_9ACTN|nr:low affinity iron permease family protein [Nocardioides gansuensis]PVG82572.1 hypothetical protein DDE18_13055 [Nocardioides gansuensis]